MKIRWKIVVPAVVLATLLVGFLVLRIANGGTPADTRARTAPIVRLEQPTRQTVVDALHFTGDVVAISQANIFAKVTGTLERVYVDMGTQVRKGQLLALIDTTELAQTFQQASATFENAKLNFRRSKELFEQNLVARQELDNAEAALKVASASFDAAKTRLGYAFITAPFAGYITKRFLDPGAVVSQNNATLFTLMDLDQLKIVINVLEKDIPRIAQGRKATITVDAFPEQQFTGTVTRYSEALDPATRTMAVEIDIDNAKHVLKPGMFANVDLTVSERRNALTLPTVAILKDDSGTFVFTVVSDTARQVRVQTSQEQSGRTEIRSGLDASTPVITIGQQFVRANGPVTVQK